VAGSWPPMVSHHTTPMQTTTTTTETTTPTAPASVPVPARRSRATRYWIALGACLVVVVPAGIAAAVVHTPYATLSPGRARAAAPAVRVEGTPSYPAEGEILYLTVGVDGEVSLLEAATGWVDPDVDVLPREEVFGAGVSTEENRRINAAAMVGSKQTALVVALRRLGYALDPTGTGAVILSTQPDTPADGVLEVGDTIVAVDGAAVDRYEDLAPTVSARSPGDEVVLTVESQDGEQRTETLTLAARPDDPSAGFLGVTGDTRDYDPGLPFDIDIDSGQVGGPSAGLAFTLAVLDVLTEGELTGGRTVAVTGTILDDGSVGPVGGVAQKAAAAAGAGAEVLLVPADEEAEARGRDHGLEIVPVATLDDALEALVALGGDPLRPAG